MFNNFHFLYNILPHCRRCRMHFNVYSRKKNVLYNEFVRGDNI